MEKNHQETKTTTDECPLDIHMSQPPSPSCSPVPTPREESMSIDIHMSQPPSSSCSPVLTPREESMEHTPQLTPQEQTPPLPAISACQQMLHLSNPRYVCYANAGTNLLFSSPLVTRFLSALPDNNAGLNIVTQLATLEPSSVGNLKDLRKTVGQNTELKWNNDSIQEDTCEWIEALYNTIWQLLEHNGNMQTNWYNLFNCHFIITYECCNNSNHKSKAIISDIIL